MEWEGVRTAKDFLARLSEARETSYRQSLELARRELADVDPAAIARQSGAAYETLGDGRGVFTLFFLGQNYAIAYPGFEFVAPETGRTPPVYCQVVMLHYLKTVDNAYVPAGFVSFGGLPHGRAYERALLKGPLEMLARAYADNLNHFNLAARALRGRPLKMEGSKDVAFSFWPLPRLPMGVAFAPADDKLSLRARLFVDINTEQWLPLYDTAVVGRLLCRTLVKLKAVVGSAAPA